MQYPPLGQQVKRLSAAYRPGLLHRVPALTATVPAVRVAAASTTQTVPQTLTAIPCYAWVNRGKGELTG
jgi:hypothetical protein